MQNPYYYVANAYFKRPNLFMLPEENLRKYLFIKIALSTIKTDSMTKTKPTELLLSFY